MHTFTDLVDRCTAFTLAALGEAAEMRREGGALENGWLNNGPAALVKQLPDAWEERLQTVFSGVALKLQSLGLNPDWPAHVRATLADLGKRLGHVL